MKSNLVELLLWEASSITFFLSTTYSIWRYFTEK